LRLAIASLLAAFALLVVVRATAGDSNSTGQPIVTVTKTISDKNARKQAVHLAVKVRFEHRRYLNAAHYARRLIRTLAHRPSTNEAITLACITYGSCSTLWRRARCESGLNRYAVNSWSGASGLFQFLPSTFRTTPFRGMSIFSPYANAMAAGWMQSVGRGGEWVCH
jgi:hypothetical protein